MTAIILKNAYSLLTYETAFVALSTIVNIFFVLYFLGFLKNKNTLVETISFFLKIFIGLFLALKFNPFYSFTNHGNKFTNLDRRIVFSAGMYILIINSIVLYDNYLKETSRKKLSKKADIWIQQLNPTNTVTKSEN